MTSSYDHVLFVGTGGGNDSFSTTIGMAMLWHLGWRWQSCDIAGVLSPFHRHIVVPLNAVGLFQTRPNSKRFLLRYDDPGEIVFADASVSKMVHAEHPFATQRVLGLSLEGGTRQLTETFRALAKLYDRIVLVDLGGDIFYGGERDPHVLSPMFDAMVLRAYLDAGIENGLLIEAGPGTDGELEPEALRASFQASEAEAVRIPDDVIANWEALWKRWIEPARPGRTVPITVDAHRSVQPEIKMPYRARAHFGKTGRWYAYHDQRIATDLCRYIYLTDPRKISNPFAIRCDGPLDWFVKTQLERPTNHEANLEYLHHDGGLWQLVTPSPLFKASDRREQFEAVLGHQGSTHACDGYWLLPSDWDELRPAWESRFQVTTDGPLVTLQ